MNARATSHPTLGVFGRLGRWLARAITVIPVNRPAIQSARPPEGEARSGREPAAQTPWRGRGRANDRGGKVLSVLLFIPESGMNVR